MRPMGDVLLDLEVVISEMIDDHDLQHGDVLSLVRGYLEIHYPGAKEEYVDGDEIVYYYGPKSLMSSKTKKEKK